VITWRRKLNTVDREFGEMGKWSEGDQWEVNRDGAREESEDVITRSRIWFLS